MVKLLEALSKRRVQLENMLEELRQVPKAERDEHEISYVSGKLDENDLMRIMIIQNYR